LRLSICLVFMDELISLPPGTNGLPRLSRQSKQCKCDTSHSAISPPIASTIDISYVVSGSKNKTVGLMSRMELSNHDPPLVSVGAMYEWSDQLCLTRPVVVSIGIFNIDGDGTEYEGIFLPPQISRVFSVLNTGHCHQ